MRHAGQVRTVLRVVGVTTVVAGLAVGARVVATTPAPSQGEVAPAVVVTPAPSVTPPTAGTGPTSPPDAPSPTSEGQDDPAVTTDAAATEPGAESSASPTPTPSPTPHRTGDDEAEDRGGIVTVTVPPVAPVWDDHDTRRPAPTPTEGHR